MAAVRVARDRLLGGGKPLVQLRLQPLVHLLGSRACRSRVPPAMPLRPRARVGERLLVGRVCGVRLLLQSFRRRQFVA